MWCEGGGSGDKVMRLTAQAAQFHSGSVHLREDEPWVGDLVAALSGFPGVRHDDQVELRFTGARIPQLARTLSGRAGNPCEFDLRLVLACVRIGRKDWLFMTKGAVL